MKSTVTRNAQNVVHFEISKNLGVQSDCKSGWTKEANIVQWNDEASPILFRQMLMEQEMDNFFQEGSE